MQRLWYVRDFDQEATLWLFIGNPFATGALFALFISLCCSNDRLRVFLKIVIEVFVLLQ
jgi:hypothetical protein